MRSFLLYLSLRYSSRGEDEEEEEEKEEEEEEEKKKKTNREEKPADVFLTDFCSHNIESRRVIVSSSER